MTIRLSAEGRIALEGDCSSEDAEPLLQMLQTHPNAEVDLRPCEAAHTAVIQVLLAAEREVHGPPAGRLLNDWVYPLLSTSFS
jgi:hypothetical protein